MSNTSPAIKAVAIICLILTIVALLMAYLNPSKGYEISLYESTPLPIWIFLISSIAGSVLLLLHEAYTGRYKISNLWLAGAFILLLNRLSLLYIPFIRGYYTWDGDNITHMGYLVDILTGHPISGDVIYPLTHVLLAELVYFTNFSVQTVVNYSTGIISMLFAIFVLLLAMTVFKSKEHAIMTFAAAAGAFILYGYDVYLMPNGWSVMLLPLAIYLLFKESYQYKILLLLMLAVYPFFHPLSALILIGIVVLYLLVRKADAMRSGAGAGIGKNDRFLVLAVIFGLIALVTWILASNIFNPNIMLLYGSIATHINVSTMGDVASSMKKTNMDGWGLVELIFKKLGQEIIYILITLAGLAYLAYHKVRYGKLLAGRNMIIVYVVTLFLGLIYFCYLFNLIPLISAFGADRVLAYLMIFTPLGVVAFFSNLRIPKAYMAALLFGVIMIVGVISIFNIYYSPYTFMPNIQVTDMNMMGMKWLIDYKNPTAEVVYTLSPPFRYVDGIIGKEEQLARGDFMYLPRMPDHFMYDKNLSMRQYFRDHYMAISMYDRMVYSSVWKNIGRYTDQDFARLETDSVVWKLYDNGELKTYFIV